jgi:hypothetical protein
MKKKMDENEIDLTEIDMVEEIKEKPRGDKTDKVSEYLLSLSDGQYLDYIQKVNNAREIAAREKRLKRKK